MRRLGQFVVTSSIVAFATFLVAGAASAHREGVRGERLIDKSELLLGDGERAPRRFETTRLLHLGSGRAQKTFTLRERSGVILINRLTVPHGVRAYVDARIPRVAGARVASNDPSLFCRRGRSFSVCTQSEEWCPMPQAIWRFHLVKLSGPAGAVRVDFVVGKSPPGA